MRTTYAHIVGRSTGDQQIEHILRAASPATVKATTAKAGHSLAVDQAIVEFE